jgi:Domain of unknown function (DUF4189)
VDDAIAARMTRSPRGERVRRAAHWCAVAYSSQNGASGWAWNHLEQRTAEKMALHSCQGPQPEILVSGAEITIAMACGPQGVAYCQWAHPSMVTQSCEGAIQNCRDYFPVGDPEREQVSLSLVLDARRGPMYQR